AEDEHQHGGVRRASPGAARGRRAARLRIAPAYRPQSSYRPDVRLRDAGALSARDSGRAESSDQPAGSSGISTVGGPRPYQFWVSSLAWRLNPLPSSASGVKMRSALPKARNMPTGYS